MSSVIHQHPIEADDTKVSRTMLLREASGEGKGVSRSAHHRRNWKKKNIQGSTLAPWFCCVVRKPNFFKYFILKIVLLFTVFTWLKKEKDGLIFLLIIFFYPVSELVLGSSGSRESSLQGELQKRQRNTDCILIVEDVHISSSFDIRRQVGMCELPRSEVWTYCLSILFSSTL